MKIKSKAHLANLLKNWSGREDLNFRPPVPQSGKLFFYINRYFNFTANDIQRITAAYQRVVERVFNMKFTINLSSFLGWVFALNMAAVLSMAGWIPTLIGIDVQTYVLVAFFISLPVALWIEIGCGGKN